MIRQERVAALGLAAALVALVACSGGETAQQETGGGEMASTAMAESTEMAEGHAMETGEMEQGKELPAGVTEEMISQGKEVYTGAGLCYVCHGGEGKGMPGLGADLTDGKWVHSDGSFEGIVQTVMNGVDSGKSTSGTAMPARGGSGITDEQVKAVSAYVYKLGHGDE
ncbi:MAG: c-type cytochrome [Gemmatimonadota bacterium]|nr:MAG: c-type cytochrome [Gemmatimonadota bacterium]